MSDEVEKVSQYSCSEILPDSKELSNLNFVTKLKTIHPDKTINMMMEIISAQPAPFCEFIFLYYSPLSEDAEVGELNSLF
jgi:hypothetical protein